MVKYSVIIPAYNCEKYISKCIESIICQSYDNFELIIIDDGSTDKTVEIISDYEKKTKKIRFIKKKNEGVSITRNYGLKISEGKYITFIDADDYVSDCYFNKLDEFIEKHRNADLYNFGFYSEVEDKNGLLKSSDIINYREIFLENKEELKKNLVNLYDNTMLYNPVNKIYRKKIIDDNNICFPNYNFGEDVEFNRRYLKYTTSLYNSDMCLYHYVREREESTTKKFKDDLFNIRKNEFYEFNNYFEQWGINKKEYFEFSSRRYIERVLGCIENEFCIKSKFVTKYKHINKMIKDQTTRMALKNAIPKSKKIHIMLIPIKMKMTLLTYIMGKLIHLIKDRFPNIFNKMKNKR